MHQTVAKLLQIQNLELSISEDMSIFKAKKGGKSHIYGKIKKKVEQLKRKIPYEFLLTYEVISKRYEVKVTPIIKNTCTGCFMKLAPGEAYEIKFGKKIPCCPFCNRFLFYEEEPESTSCHSDCAGIARFSAPWLMFPSIEGRYTSPFYVLRKIGENICETGIIKRKDDFIDALINREKILSTAVGEGLAFPHARGNFGCGLTFAITILKDGFDFENGEKVFLVITFSVPTNINKFYLDAVAKLIGYFSDRKHFNKMLNCKSYEEMWNIIVRLGN